MELSDTTAAIAACDDGSRTLIHPLFGESYHSLRGAYGESRHVYIENGLKEIDKQHVVLLEMGFGSGLNFLLTADYALCYGVTVDYTTIERYPVDLQTARALEYDTYCNHSESYPLFCAAHSACWETATALHPQIRFTKTNCDLLDFSSEKQFDLIYFDAFAYDAQPELWSREVFAGLWAMLAVGGVLVTYSAKGIVKENLRAAGFAVSRRKGALGKRHLVIARKSSTI